MSGSYRIQGQDAYGEYDSGDVPWDKLPSNRSVSRFLVSMPPRSPSLSTSGVGIGPERRLTPSALRRLFYRGKHRK